MTATQCISTATTSMSFTRAPEHGTALSSARRTHTGAMFTSCVAMAILSYSLMATLVSLYPVISSAMVRGSSRTGVWAFHCHVAWHASGGFFSSFIVEPEKVGQMRIPRDVERNCRAWDQWSKHNVVVQIDSGT